MRRIPTLLLAVLLLAGAAACGDDGDEVSTDPPGATEPGEPGVDTEPAPVEDPLAGRRFVAAEVEGHEIVPGTEISVAFSEGQVEVETGCNHISGTYAYDDGRVVVSDVSGTEMGCGADLAAQEAWLYDLLGQRLAVEAAPDGAVVLAAGADALTLVEEPEAPPAPLVGTTWTLEAILEGETASSVPAGVTATLTLADDGTYEVAAGCNTGSGTWAEGRSGLYDVEAPTLTRRRCDPAAMGVEARVVALLDGEVSADVEGDRLTLVDMEDTGASLVLTAG